MVDAELTHKGDRIEIRFPYDEKMVERMRTVAGRRWNKAESAWTVPADWQSAVELRRAFGRDLTLGPHLREWGRREKARQEKLTALARADTATLDHLPVLNRRLYEAIHLGPRGIGMGPEERQKALQGPASFQAADVRFMVDSSNPLNACHMGLGKTIETIAAIEEAGLADGPILVVAPVSAAEGTWPEELRRWQDRPFWLARGTAKEKQAVHDEFRAWTSPLQTNLRMPTGTGDGAMPGQGGWLIINPEQLMLREKVEKCPDHQDVSHKSVKGLKIIQQCSKNTWKVEREHCHYEIIEPYPDLFRIRWTAIVFDESHEFGIMNPKSLTGRGALRLRTWPGGKKILLSGTPMGGQPIKLFHILHYLHPTVFTSKWRFAEQYLETNDNGYGKTIGGIRRCDDHRARGFRPTKGDCQQCDEYERRLFEMLNPFILRRTKDEVLKDLPPKQHVDLWCSWGSPDHQQQYEEFAGDSETVVGDERISALGVLSEYTRLGQFAFGRWEKRGGTLVPTEDSGKLHMINEKLKELGIFDPDGEEQVVIFSQYRTVVDVIYNWLVRRGVPTGKITGDTNKKGERAAAKEAFQGSETRAIVITTKAGGTSLTLDRASHVFIVDETWKPDDQEQAEDRCHRASRIHQVTIYRLLTKHTIDEYRREINWEKAAVNKNVMDLRRIKLKEDSDE
jgi:SNF2 family DNA or RNA helicase